MLSLTHAVESTARSAIKKNLFIFNVLGSRIYTHLATNIHKISNYHHLKRRLISLQPDDELCAEGNILAGPFHPSMGELVQSYLLREQLTPQILGTAKQSGDSILILCPNKLESKVRGLRNGNIKYWSVLVAPRKLILKGISISKIKIICVSSNDLEEAATQD